MASTRDSISDFWGPRTPQVGSNWPVRVDQNVDEEPDRWVQACCFLCSNGCGIDIGVKDDQPGGRIDEWKKDIAPSTELRQWFGHDPARWAEFQRRYRAELQQHGEELDRIRDLARTQTVTLVYSAHDEEHNDAVVLKEVLLEETRSP